MNRTIVALTFCSIIVMIGCQKTSNPPFPPAPSVNAGPSQTITLPVDSVRLSGSAHDSSSRITGYIWSQVSGPNTALIADDGSPVTEVYGLSAGTYVFQLMAVDSLGQTGLGTLSVFVKGGPVTVVLNTLFPGTNYSPYELTLLANSSNPLGNNRDIELLAETWTIGGTEVWGRSYFKFNMSPIPAGANITSATLVLFSDTIPENGDLIHANYGTTNDFWIQRVAANWDQNTNFNTQPAVDSIGGVHVPQTSQPFLNLSLDVTTMVNNMAKNGNNGFVMRLNTEQIYNSRIFCSSLYSDTTRHPYMTVTYKLQ
ncbi:MAG TPA: DNRLRE domain-containing protein [Puia sp.]|jgi:hypothetical protein|nr:DNRLRE domain-containing protein [Puia sp.]